MMTFPAHICSQGDGTKKVQTVAEHCRKTACYAEECLSGIGLSKAVYLAGL